MQAQVRTIVLELTTTQAAYLLGSVGVTLQEIELPARDRDALVQLRDILVSYLDLDPDVKIALGIGEVTRLQ